MGGKSSKEKLENSLQTPNAPNAALEQPTCPVPEQFRSQSVYNVYNQRINDPNAAPSSDPMSILPGYDALDPKNMMPIEPNQQPCPGQKKLLSTQRMQSNIPKGGTSSTWQYPSPQMFYNALKRKGKGDDVTEEDMEAVVHSHNTMNELTWQRVQTWELLHRHECPSPSLLRFRGRPDDLSPLARIRNWLGGPLPFDRHDWYVDRCGTEVRYVIDFYFDDNKAGSPEAFDISVRPALDSFDALMDCIKMQIYIKFARYGLPCPITGSQGQVGQASAGSSSPSHQTS